MRRLPCSVILFALLLCGARLDAQTTALYVESPAWDWVGGGVTHSYTPSNATFSAAPTGYSRMGTEIAVATTDPSIGTWRLDFSAPAWTGALPAAGTYTNARAYPWTSFNGLSVGHFHGCPSVQGRFVVLEAVYGPNNSVIRFAADFEQHCNSQDVPIYGAVRYNSTISTLTPFGGAYGSNVLQITKPLHGTISGDGLNCGTGGETCVVSWTSPTTASVLATPDPGYMLAGWTGGCHGTPTTSVRVNSEIVCSAEFQPLSGIRRYLWTITGEVNDYTLGRRSESFSLANSIFSAQPHMWGGGWWLDNESVGTLESSDFAGLFITSASRDLALGSFTGGNNPSTPPFVTFVGEARGCTTNAGEFKVLDYSTTPDGRLATLAIDFSRPCYPGGPAQSRLAGSIRYNSTVDPHVPLLLTITGGGRVSAPGIMDCSADCVGFPAAGTAVALTPEPKPGYKFTGWTGDGACSSGSFTAMTGIRCTANFTSCPVTLSQSQLTFDASGGAMQVNVTAGAGCGWSFTPTSWWLSGSAAGLNTGNGSITISVPPRRSSQQRAETVSVGVAGVTDLVLTQQGGVGLPMHAPMWGQGGIGSDIAIWRPEGGGWFFKTAVSNYINYVYKPFGSAGDTPVTGDFDGDGLADLAVWRGSTGVWYVRTSGSGYTDTQAYQWGAGALGDIPVAADFDGDGRTDLAVWRASSGYWYVKASSSNYASYFAVQWGAGALGDIPIVGDFDGDEKADIAVWRRADGYWYMRFSKDNYASMRFVQWGVGSLGDVPVAGDYDGDGRTDIAVWRASTGYWYIKTAASNFATFQAIPWGAPGSGDTPLIGDYDGDGRTDLALWRPSDGVWRIKTSSSNWASTKSIQWGASALGDVPLPKLPPR